MLNRSRLIAAGIVTICLVTLLGIGTATPGIHLSNVGDEKAAERKLAEPPGNRGLISLATERVSGLGLVEPRGGLIELSAPEPGVVTRLLVHEGDNVQPGDELVELDQQPQRAALVAAEAELVSAQLRLDRLVNGATAEERTRKEALLESAGAEAEFALRAVERNKPLRRTGAVSEEVMEKLISEARVRQAQLNERRADLAELIRGARPDDIAVTRQEVKVAQAKFDVARIALERRTIRAPSAGTILRFRVRAGELHTPERETPLLLMANTRELIVRLEVDERDALRLKAGSRAFLTDYALGATQVPAVVEKIIPRVSSKRQSQDRPGERFDVRVVEVTLRPLETTGMLPGMRLLGMLEAGPMNQQPPSEGPQSAM